MDQPPASASPCSDSQSLQALQSNVPQEEDIYSVLEKMNAEPDGGDGDNDHDDQG